MLAEELNQIELTAYTALIEASGLLQQSLGRQLQRDAGITQAQFEILAYVVKAPDGLRMSELAARAVLSRSGMTYRVSQLEKLGLMKRAMHGDDERGVVAFATPEGSALIRRLLPDHLALLRRSFLSALSMEDLSTLGDILSRVVKLLREPGGEPPD